MVDFPLFGQHDKEPIVDIRVIMVPDNGYMGYITQFRRKNSKIWEDVRLEEDTKIQ